MSSFTIVGIGEVLWDIFPDEQGGPPSYRLGGAPTNFAYIANLLGDRGLVASRIGSDAHGTEVAARFQQLKLNPSHLQVDPQHPTGTARVQLAAGGQPHFEITQSVAWDFLQWTPAYESLAAHADAVCFGSLAQRGLQSRETIRRFLAATRPDAIRVFDVNLRQAFYSQEVLVTSIQAATVVKLNHEELPIVIKSLSGPQLDELNSAQWLCRRFDLDLVCITRGLNGSLLVSRTGHDSHPGYPTIVADTVGAGDAFTATLIHHRLRASSLSTTNAAANRIGAWVASRPGATPPAEPDQIAPALVTSS